MQRVVPFDVPSSVILHAVWAQVVQLLTLTLPGWDAWCPDDGRLAAGLAMIVRYLDEPAPDPPTSAALAEAKQMISDAYAMVDAAVDHTDDAATWRAWNVARTAYILLGTLMDRPQIGEEGLLTYVAQSVNCLRQPE